MPNWKWLAIKRPSRTISEDDVTEALGNILRERSRLVPHDGAPAPGDMIVANLRFLDGDKLLSEANELEIVIRPKLSFADASLAGFDTLVKQAKAGTTVTASVKVWTLAADATSFTSTVTRGEACPAWQATLGGSRRFRAHGPGTPQLDNLIPWPYFTRTVGIDVGAGAALRGGSVSLTAEAEELKLVDRLGLSGFPKALVQIATNFVTDFLDLPLKVLIKKTTATIDVGSSAQIVSAGNLNVAALAMSDSTASAKSEIVSLGFSWAEATATVNVGAGATLKAGGTLDVLADGSAIAKMDSETAREEPNSSLGALEKFSGSIAVTDAKLTSQAIVGAGAILYGGRTANVRALGVVESEAGSEAQMMADGTAAVSAAVQLSTADVLTKIGGTVRGDLYAGDTPTFEFDPTIQAADYESDQSGQVRVHKAEGGWVATTVRLKNDVA
ncbi:MAG: hypothetical protein WCJ31_22010, partial [Planctomycetia bacterium]